VGRTRLRRFSAAPTNSRRGGDTAPSYDSSVRRRTPRVHRNRRGTRTVVEGRASIVTSPGGTAAPGSWIHHVGVLNADRVLAPPAAAEKRPPAGRATPPPQKRRDGAAGGATPPRLRRDATAPRAPVARTDIQDLIVIRSSSLCVHGPPASIRWAELVCGASPPRQRIVGAAATRLPRTIHRCGGGRRASTETAAELVLWSRGGHRL